MEKSDRFNKDKPRWSLLHFKSLEPLIRVLEFGAKKYSSNNWMIGLDLKEIQDSMQRHLAAIMDEENRDHESGELHIAHVMCNAMFWIYHYNKINDEEKNEKQISAKIIADNYKLPSKGINKVAQPLIKDIKEIINLDGDEHTDGEVLDLVIEYLDKLEEDEANKS